MLCFQLQFFFFVGFTSVWFIVAQSGAMRRRMLVLCFLLAGWQVCGGQSVQASRLCSVVTASYLTQSWPVPPPPHLLSFPSSLTSL